MLLINNQQVEELFNMKACLEALEDGYDDLVMVFSVRNGEPLAIINDGLIQHMRVGGCAGIGAKYLARQDACDVGIFGSGGMARSYLEAFYEVRDLKRVRVYSPTKAN